MDLLNSDEYVTMARCFSSAVWHLLRDGEGIVVELSKHDDTTEFKHGKFIVFKDVDVIKITEYDGESIAGMLVWIK